MNTEITIDEWLSELNRISAASGCGDEGLTSEEIGESIGKSSKWVCKYILRPGVNAGRIVSGQRQCFSIAGHRRYVPVYRVVESVSTTKPARKR